VVVRVNERALKTRKKMKCIFTFCSRYIVIIFSWIKSEVSSLTDLEDTNSRDALFLSGKPKDTFAVKKGVLDKKNRCAII
jgi:hypothetical protein